jgi:putative transposase
MARRLPASMRTREELTSLIEGRLFTASAKDAGLLRAWSPSRKGYRNGYRSGRLKTAEGAIEYSAPQVAGRAEP